MSEIYEIEPESSSVELKDIIKALEESQIKPGARSVLVVDDEQSIRRLVSRSMKGLDKNLNIHEAENGQEALDRLAELRAEGNEPVLIVTDLQMPVMDGWEFIEQLRKQYQQAGLEFGIPVIVLSASSGSKGFIFGKSVVGGNAKYRPLVAVAKEECIKPFKYDAQGVTGLVAWLKYFMRKQG